MIFCDRPANQAPCECQIHHLHVCVCVVWKRLLFYSCCSCHRLWGLVFINILMLLCFNTITWSEGLKMTWAGPIHKVCHVSGCPSQGRSPFMLLAWHDFCQQHPEEQTTSYRFQRLWKSAWFSKSLFIHTNEVSLLLFFSSRITQLELCSSRIF